MSSLEEVVFSDDADIASKVSGRTWGEAGFCDTDRGGGGPALSLSAGGC